MKLFSLQILYKTDTSAKLLQASHELSDFGYFQRSSVREFMDFTAKVVCERTARCQRVQIKQQDYICHVYVRHDNLCGVLICDQEYPPRVAQTLLTKATEDFALQCPASTWANMTVGSDPCKKIHEYLQKYQNPTEADGLMRLQNELDETKVILPCVQHIYLTSPHKLRIKQTHGNHWHLLWLPNKCNLSVNIVADLFT
ncbi:unnamed protein product [Schistosoma bovis]|nr:unnamed protein product [Schistosoma bovis]